MKTPERTPYCWSCGSETRGLRLFLSCWLCSTCIRDLAPTFAEEKEHNERHKTQPAISTDCNALDHTACEGEESALWPDGSFTIRRCNCPCHTAKI